MNLPFIAFNYLNDYYNESMGIEDRKKDDPIINKIKNRIRFRDLLWKFRLFPPTFLITIIFKENIDPKPLQQEAYEVIPVIRNPYIKEDEK